MRVRYRAACGFRRAACPFWRVVFQFFFSVMISVFHRRCLRFSDLQILDFQVGSRTLGISGDSFYPSWA